MINRMFEKDCTRHPNSDNPIWENIVILIDEISYFKPV